MQRNTYYPLKSNQFNGEGKGTYKRIWVLLAVSILWRTPMKKNRLTSDYSFDFDLIGIVCPAKEYKLAWHLNALRLFHLVKEEDIKIEFSGNKQVRISTLGEESDFIRVNLMRNRLVSGSAPATNNYLLPEVHQFDYLLKVHHQADENWADTLLLRLKEVPVVDYAVKIEIEKLKSKENLLF